MTNRQPFVRIFQRAFLPALLLLCSCAQSMATDVEIAWNPSTSTNISGYKVYVGYSSGTYGPPITIGNQTAYTVGGLTDGTYYFAVTAFDNYGVESVFSNEIFMTISTPTVSCDINGDSSINTLDLQALTNAILGSASSQSGYDLNQDSYVDVLDLQILSNVVLGLRSCP
jgi:fibronectin type 3 domain-containing protein